MWMYHTASHDSRCTYGQINHTRVKPNPVKQNTSIAQRQSEETRPVAAPRSRSRKATKDQEGARGQPAGQSSATHPPHHMELERSAQVLFGRSQRHFDTSPARWDTKTTFNWSLVTGPQHVIMHVNKHFKREHAKSNSKN